MALRPISTRRWRALAARLAADRRAATAVEYGLILALIVLVMLTALKSVANGTTGLWADVSTKVVNASQ